jgi:hypothetical protein
MIGLRNFYEPVGISRVSFKFQTLVGVGIPDTLYRVNSGPHCSFLKIMFYFKGLPVMAGFGIVIAHNHAVARKRCQEPFSYHPSHTLVPYDIEETVPDTFFSYIVH